MSQRTRFCRRFLIASGVILFTCPINGADVDSLLATIRAVPTSGEGNAEVARAWKELVQSEPEELPRILTGLDDAGPLAANWIRSAVDAIAERAKQKNDQLPVSELEQFTLNRARDPRARRLAFEWLQQVDAEAASRLIPKMVNDPSVELRRDAVARLIAEANRLLERNSDEAPGRFEEALNSARDDDQIKQIVKTLRSLGRKVDLQKHFGFVTQWKVIGPFDNTGLKGFERTFPPEQEPFRDTTYAGKVGEVHWVAYETDDDYGMVDFNQPLGSLKEVVGYAWTEFESERGQDVELRLGCKNAWKLWLNGEMLFGRDEYHRGMKLDQYRVKARLQPGKNQILVKLCQNEQVETWTVEWQFQLRICDSTGTAILPSSGS